VACSHSGSPDTNRQAAAEEQVYRLVTAKLEAGYSRQRPDAAPLETRPFLEIASVHPCPKCGTKLQVCATLDYDGLRWWCVLF
jgi:hypothetical protein